MLAAGAYGVATQAGDDSAEAAGKTTARATARGPGGPGPGLGGLADRLGVSKAKLRAALQAIRADGGMKRGPEDRLLAPLARELRVSEAQLTAAFEKLQKSREADHAARRARVAGAVAKTLRLDAAKVRAALADVGPGMRARRSFGPRPPMAPPRHDRGERLGAAAKELGVPTAKLRSALRAARPDVMRERPERGDHPMATELGKALGIDAATVRKALESVRTAERKDGSARRDAFAAKLAKELGIPESKVRSALPDGPGRGGPGMHGGWRHGPGGPGPGGPDGDHGPDGPGPDAPPPGP